MIYYLPSCKVKAQHPDTSEKIQRYLSAQGVMVVGCCKASQSQFQKGDTVITNCTSCAIITNEQSPSVKEISLYEYFLTDVTFPWPNYERESIVVQDCYRATHKPEVQLAIRKCLKKMNFNIIELEENFEKTKFDGTFKYNPVPTLTLQAAPKYYGKFSEEFVEVIPKEQQEELLKQWVSTYPNEKVAVYCNSCLAGAKIGDANVVHILDLLAKNL